MHVNNYLLSIRALLRSVAIWFIVAFLLLLMSAAILSSINVSSNVLAYISSAISLLAAMCAAASALHGRSAGRILSALLFSLILCVILLILGFLIKGRNLSTDGILSIVMFTFSGALIAALFKPKSRKKSKIGTKRTRVQKS